MTTLKFTQYQREAQIEPLPIELSDGVTITFPVPNGETMMAIEEAGQTRKVLRLLCGDDGTWSKLEPEVKRIQDPAALREFVMDVMGHFGMGTRSAPGGWVALIEMIERYGEEIEADLFERGWDLLDYFRARRPWAQLARLVDHLPAWSQAKRAMVDDDELQRYRDGHRAGADRPRRITEWTFEDELMTTIVDAAMLVRTAIIAANTPHGRKPPVQTGSSSEDGRREAAARRDQMEIAEIIEMVKPRE